MFIILLAFVILAYANASCPEKSLLGDSYCTSPSGAIDHVAGTVVDCEDYCISQNITYGVLMGYYYDTTNEEESCVCIYSASGYNFVTEVGNPIPNMVCYSCLNVSLPSWYDCTENDHCQSGTCVQPEGKCGCSTDNDCNGRGTCNTSTTVCDCSGTTDYWGIDCNTLIDCNTGVKMVNASYCECPYPTYGQSCENTKDCSGC